MGPRSLTFFIFCRPQLSAKRRRRQRKGNQNLIRTHDWIAKGQEFLFLCNSLYNILKIVYCLSFNSRAKPKKKKRRMDKLMNEASMMMSVASKAAKAHHKYIKAMAANKDICVSSSDSS